jgi:hypothetical protein
VKNDTFCDSSLECEVANPQKSKGTVTYKYQLHSEYVRDPSQTYCSQQWTWPSVCGRNTQYTIDTVEGRKPPETYNQERERERDTHTHTSTHTHTLTLEGLSSTYLV